LTPADQAGGPPRLRRASFGLLEPDDAEVPRPFDSEVTERPEVWHRTELDVGLHAVAEQIVETLDLDRFDNGIGDPLPRGLRPRTKR